MTTEYSYKIKRNNKPYDFFARILDRYTVTVYKGWDSLEQRTTTTKRGAHWVARHIIRGRMKTPQIETFDANGKRINGG